MTLLDASDEALARAVFRELEIGTRYSIRERADDAPVSRSTLSRWNKGLYSMRMQTRRDLIEWLESRGVTSVPPAPPEDVAGRARTLVEKMRAGENEGDETEGDVA